MRYLKLTMIIILIAGMNVCVFADTNARIKTIEGNAQVKITGEGRWIPAETGMALHSGDIIKTERDSYVILDIDHPTKTATVEVKESSELMLAELMKDKKSGKEETLLDLAIGEVLIQANKLNSSESRFEVKTPTSIVGVRGTKFSVKVEALE
jgi:hypothetical protein